MNPTATPSDPSASALFTTPLVTAEALRAHRQAVPPASPGAWVLLDCSFDLADPAAGARAYAQGHVPGAHYLHLDEDLSDRRQPDPVTGRDPRGRHPLPPPAALAARLGRLGIAVGTRVVVYDRQGGMFAGRAWWLLQRLGHAEVALLDGGLAAWQAAGGALQAGAAADPAPPDAPPYPLGLPPRVRELDAPALLSGLGRLRIVDARAPERFRGEVEPLDPVAGHIPGALNRPFAANLQADGRFKSPEQLRQEWAPLLLGAGASASSVVHHCGSGVTACHNLIAQRVAGFDDGVLYPGSWSEWCADPARPVARA